MGFDRTAVACAREVCNSSFELAWFERLPCLKELPWVAVATAPPIVWSMNQLKAGRVYPSGAFLLLIHPLSILTFA